MAIRLIAGIGNPGSRYARTRHNVGWDWVADLADRFGVTLREDTKWNALLGRGHVLGHDVRLLIPLTFVNRSGDALGPLARFFKIDPTEVLVAYDEVAFPPGISKLKLNGGHNGHNGIKSIIQGFGNSKDFPRLRIGVGHPGDKNAMIGYLTGVKIPSAEQANIDASLAMDDSTLRSLLGGDLATAMNEFNRPRSDDEG